jgi:PST family polysaccharide transporter
VAILGSVMLFKASEVALYWFESQVKSKYTVWVQNGSFLVFALIKVILILNQASLLVFAWATMLEALMVALLMTIMLGFKGIKLLDLRVSLARVKSLLTDSWPLLLSGIAIMIYMRIDQLMLGQMADDHVVGIYSAASRISEVWYFMIGIVLTSVFPTLASQHAENNDFLSIRWIQIYRVMFWLSITSALIVTFGSSYLVGLLYGNAYQEAEPVLCILVWAGVNVAIGLVWSNWLLLENKMEIGLYGHLVGAGLNVFLNFFMIPDFGAIGAAYATLISYWISALFVYSLHKPRQTYSLIFEAIFFWRLK